MSKIICSKCHKPKPEYGKKTICRDCHCAYMREYNRTHPENKIKKNRKQRQTRIENRMIVLKYFGSKCVCCGETEPMFLQLDHKYNNGKQHRKQLNGMRIEKWLIDTNFKDSDQLQLLCANCHAAKTNYEMCPHKMVKKK